MGKRRSIQFKANHGKPCAYCARPMDMASPELMPTRDHEHPRSKGGRKIVWACWICNNIKSDKTMMEWLEFMAANPRWWIGTRKPGHGAPQQQQRAAPPPYEESLMILRHGKDHWRAWKASGKPVCECCQRKVPHVQPTFYAKDHPKVLARLNVVPKQFDDPKAQAAFEGVYKNRTYMLRDVG